MNMLTGTFHEAIDRTALSGLKIAVPALIDGRPGKLLVSVQRFEEAPVSPNTRRIRKLRSRDAERACASIKAEIHNGVRLSSVAASIGLSPSHFSRAFHATMGIPFTTYVLRQRIDTAKRLMLETDETLCEVALSSGFGDQSNFSRTFVRAVGLTPFKWRLLQRQPTAFG
jgi:AraC-like DNA-binding protein